MAGAFSADGPAGLQVAGEGRDTGMQQGTTKQAALLSQQSESLSPQSKVKTKLPR